MPSKTQHKIQFARERGFHVRHSALLDGWYILDSREGGTIWSAYGPYISKRAAKNDAYRVAVGQKPLLPWTF